ncbi:hypothetical protein KY285_023918 [Solanum tuberosum]|nr:hypothetical protein KY289_024259 [Solanum tuberosum]KAH0676117.1 hypothetical protein KY285_023918 [Solanum tuberosum]
MTGSIENLSLNENQLVGLIPEGLSDNDLCTWPWHKESVATLKVSGNNFDPPLPKFKDSVKVITDVYARLVGKVTVAATIMIIIVFRKMREDSVTTVLEEDPKMCTTNCGNLVNSTQDL